MATRAWSTFLEYWRAVCRHWVAFVTGSLLIALYTVLVLGFPDTPGKTWHFWNHLPPLAVLSLAVLGMILAQFLAWRDVRDERNVLRTDLETLRSDQRPDIDERLELLEEAPSLTVPDDSVTREIEKTFPTAPYPEHTLSVGLGVRAEIDPPTLVIECSAPIYKASAYYCRRPGKEDPVMVLDPLRRSQERVMFRFGDVPLPAGAKLLVKLYSPAPLRLKRVTG